MPPTRPHPPVPMPLSAELERCPALSDWEPFRERERGVGGNQGDVEIKWNEWWPSRRRWIPSRAVAASVALSERGRWTAVERPPREPVATAGVCVFVLHLFFHCIFPPQGWNTGEGSSFVIFVDRGGKCSATANYSTRKDNSGVSVCPSLFSHALIRSCSLCLSLSLLPLSLAQLNDTLSLICLFFTTFFSLICLSLSLSLSLSLCISLSLSLSHSLLFSRPSRSPAPFPESERFLLCLDHFTLSSPWCSVQLRTMGVLLGVGRLWELRCLLLCLQRSLNNGRRGWHLMFVP